jgi:hypothetical protein
MAGPTAFVRRLMATAIAALTVGAGLVSCSSPTPDYLISGCEPQDLGGQSVARVWDQTLLELIRQVIPAPTVHARNLFHTSAAMWDAWAAYDPTADGYFVTEKYSADDVAAARRAAISFSAYRLLDWRYGTVSDLPTAFETLDSVMSSLCYRTDFESVEGDSPAALGNRIARTIIDFGWEDGALENERYVDNSYRPLNDPMIVAESGTEMRSPNTWQPLSLGMQVAQNGLPIPGQAQSFIGPHWGSVTPFALEPSPAGTPIDPGPPPLLGDPATDDAFKDAAVEVVRYSSMLDPADGVLIDISPNVLGDNTLGTNDGDGYAENPVTGEPYDPQLVLRADFGRSIAEYWADGPESETPPGHWNLLRNAVTDSAGFERRIGGEGAEVDPLEWDVKTYFALNGALHDAAIAAWGLKGFYDSVRPISMIRYMGGKGQSSDPGVVAYDPEGLPLVGGLIEVVSEESSSPGQRHEDLRDHIGEIVIKAWRGSPEDPTTETSGVGWIRAVDWVPYQRPTFVSPSFAGYVSGHSAFSRAAAVVLESITGSPYFPGGISGWTVPAGQLLHEEGPTEDITLEWATFYDAADQAGISRLYGGIHINLDDTAGREIGAACGVGAWALANRYFDGTARP